MDQRVALRADAEDVLAGRFADGDHRRVLDLAHDDHPNRGTQQVEVVGAAEEVAAPEDRS